VARHVNCFQLNLWIWVRHDRIDDGQRPELLRKESGLTERDMAGLCNVGLPFLNQVEHGKATAQIGKVLEVCRRHGIEGVFHPPAKPDAEG
jgi:HTH-type transcriptional regulator/antitoxin HipB